MLPASCLGRKEEEEEEKKQLQSICSVGRSTVLACGSLLDCAALFCLSCFLFSGLGRDIDDSLQSLPVGFFDAVTMLTRLYVFRSSLTDDYSLDWRIDGANERESVCACVCVPYVEEFREYNESKSDFLPGSWKIPPPRLARLLSVNNDDAKLN